MRKLVTIEMVSESEKEHRHYNVSYNGTHLGYYIANNSFTAPVNVNWNFVSKHIDMPNFNTRTRQEMKDTLEKIINNEPVDLKQDFGLTEKNFTFSLVL